MPVRASDGQEKPEGGRGPAGRLIDPVFEAIIVETTAGSGNNSPFALAAQEPLHLRELLTHKKVVSGFSLVWQLDPVSSL